MPKGRIRIHGAGGYRSIRSESLQSIKKELLDDLASRRPEKLGDLNREEIWKRIDDAVASYLGQIRKGLPPTESERDQAFEKIEKAARKLGATLSDSHLNIRDFVHKAMRRQGASLYEFEKQLDVLIDLTPITDWLQIPKGRPDQYVEWLIRELIFVWEQSTGDFPGKTGTDHYKGGRTSPFYRWSNKIAQVVIEKNFPRDLTDKLIGLSRPDG